jgi:predicted GNAT family acetyltransferase
MNTTVRDKPEKMRYEITVEQDGEEVLVGFAEYRPFAGGIAVIHTEVFPEHEGQGLGTALVAAVLDTARERGQSVMPYCPFFSHYIRQHLDYLDLVPEDKRPAFDLPRSVHDAPTTGK